MENGLEQAEEYKQIAVEAKRIHDSVAKERDELLEGIREDFRTIME